MIARLMPEDYASRLDVVYKEKKRKAKTETIDYSKRRLEQTLNFESDTVK
jgi:hypothetical protein